MAERALQVAPYPRQVMQILRLAIPYVEPRKDAEDLAGALGRERHVEPDELRRIEARVGAAASAHVTAEQRDLGLFGHIYACVLQQRGEIVGGRSHHGVLEVEDAEACVLAALREPEQIRGMEIAQDPGRRRLDGGMQQL